MQYLYDEEYNRMDYTETETEDIHHDVMPDDTEDGMDDEPSEGWTDAEADADALASAGWGTDEDYGYFGGDEF